MLNIHKLKNLKNLKILKTLKNLIYKVKKKVKIENPKVLGFIKFTIKYRHVLKHLLYCLIIGLIFFYPPLSNRIAENLIDLLSNRKPPAWVQFDKGEKVDIHQTKLFKRQKLAQARVNIKGFGHDFLFQIGLAKTSSKNLPNESKNWNILLEDAKGTGVALIQFWGISVVTYEDEKGEILQTVVLGEGNKPINLNDRVLRWQKDIEAAATKYKLQPALIAAVMEQESGGDPNAMSQTGAIGLMQLMPGTASSLGVNPYDPVQNIDGGAHYLQQQLNSFGTEEAALAAYNAGPGNVQSQRWLNFSETRAYVQRVPRLEDKYKRIWQENELANQQANQQATQAKQSLVVPVSK